MPNDLDIPANEASDTFTITPLANASGNGSLTVDSILKASSSYTVSLAAAGATITNGASIVPANGQQGTTGDLVPSIKGAKGLKHYVSTKAAGSAVVLQENQLPATAWANGDVEWDVDGQKVNGVNGNPRQVQISRADAKRIEVTVWDKANNKALDTMIVWVVWADISFTKAPKKHDYSTDGLPAAQLTAGNSKKILDHGNWVGTEVGFDVESTATIQPTDLFNTTNDVPDLTKLLPGGDPILAGTDPVDGQPLAGGVGALWDMSRRKAIRAGVTDSAGNNHLYTTLPADPFTDFPAGSPHSIVGNDDSSTSDEDDNPYDAAHKGKIILDDMPLRQGPGPAVFNQGVIGDFYTSKVWFQDFARLKIGSQWYNISDPLSWRVEFHYAKVAFRDVAGNTATESDFQRDTNGDGYQPNEQVGFWDEDPNSGSFAIADNAGLPAPGA